MIVADVVGPWHNVTATDAEGHSYQDVQRLPQFLADVGDMSWRDVTAQASEQIPPVPGLCVWRVWCDEAQLAKFVELPAYKVVHSAEVEPTPSNPTPDPTGWVQRVAQPGAGKAAFAALPASGWLEAGSIYLDSGQAYIVRQSHSRTEHEPSTVPALFMVYRSDATSTLEWVAGEQVYVGMQRTYNGKTYEVLQKHVTQQDWFPPAVPALWREVVVVPPTSEWAAGVAYKVGDEVTYKGHTYKCLQAHSSISTWYPSAVPALWKLIS